MQATVNFGEQVRSLMIMMMRMMMRMMMTMIGHRIINVDVEVFLAMITIIFSKVMETLQTKEHEYTVKVFCQCNHF